MHPVRQEVKQLMVSIVVSVYDPNCPQVVLLDCSWDDDGETGLLPAPTVLFE
jgi:hypothetical protein